MTGKVIFMNPDFITAKLDKPRKKIYPTDRAYEFTAPKRLWTPVPYYEVKTDDGAFRVHNHKGSKANKPTKDDLKAWRAKYVSDSDNS